MSADRRGNLCILASCSLPSSYHESRGLPVNECEFYIDFAMAHLAVHTPANPEARALAILNHYRGSALIVALWCQLATDEFVDLVQRVQQQGIPLVCCHEQHAVFRF
jgi:hypothetical protein